MARLVPRTLVGPRGTPALRWMNAHLPRPRSGRGVIVDEVVLGITRGYAYRPRDTKGPLPALLWLHGGGFLVGTPRQDAPKCAALAREMGIVVVAPYYRLAPEHPFPAALEDASAALDAMVSRADALGIDADRIAIGGASAGGGLAASLALHVRDRGGVQPVLQLLVYPMLDDRSALRTDVDERDYRLWDVRSNHAGWSSYLGAAPGSDAPPTNAVPARAASLAGLAPAWIGVGTADLFHDEDVAYAARLEAAGVRCTLEIAEGAYHGFDEVSRGARVTKRFLASRDAALRAALHPIR